MELSSFVDVFEKVYIVEKLQVLYFKYIIQSIDFTF